jgi:hypothetical protein
MIFEDGSIWRSDLFTETDKETVANGYLQVVRQSDLKEWHDGHWRDLKKWTYGTY